jgi:hypothetical protein
MPKALVACLVLGVTTTLAGVFAAAALAWLAAAVIAAAGLHVFQPPVQPAKTKGIHRSFPLFLRLAYAWLVIAALLGAWAAAAPGIAGIGGAGRHALTVGFIAGMVLTIGPRILPAFSGMKALYSPRLMFLALALLEAGCVLRVSGELLAYPGWWNAAWHWLPFSAALEVTAFAVFAYNLIRTLLRPPAHVLRMARTGAAPIPS